MAATEFLVGTLGMKMEQTPYMPEDLETGLLASFERSEVIARETSLPFQADANYNQLHWLLDMAVDAPRTRGVYEPQYSAPNSYKSHTLEYGDNVRGWRSSYVLARQLDFSGQVGEVVRVNADLFGREMEDLPSTGFTGSTSGTPGVVAFRPWSTSTLYPTGSEVSYLSNNYTRTGPDQTGTAGTGANAAPGTAGATGWGAAVPIVVGSSVGGGLALPTALETVKMATGRLYAADTWADIAGITRGNSASGATAISSRLDATIVDFNYRIMTGLTPLKFLDARLDFSEVAQAKRHVELEMTVGFHNTVATTWFNTNFRTQAARVLGLHFNGIGNRELRLQMSGFLTEYSEITEREGQDIVKVKWVSSYDQTSGRDMRVNLVS